MIQIDMDMPKSCYSCKFVKDYNGKLYCNNSAGMTDGEYVDDCNTERHEDCPLIEPEQTMISDYFKTMQKCCKYYTYSCDWYAGQKMVDACHHRANIPSGDSWGECSEEHCPFLRKEKMND